jgi:dihydroorotase-like cyclic amidohydrolase
MRGLTRKATALASAFLVQALVGQAHGTRTPQVQPLAFTNVTVIDVGASDARLARKLDQTVVISGRRIAAVGERGLLRIPDDAQVIDAANQFLIPGLCLPTSSLALTGGEATWTLAT